jgi:NADH dehydrogenase FAD-containing subunit
MGNSVNITPEMKNKHVVVVGYSYAGQQCVNMFKPHFKVTVIDQNDYFEQIACSLKSNVEYDFPDRVLHPLDKIAAAFNVTFRQATLVNVNTDNTIEILPASGETKGELIKFDYLIICTGFSYAKPLKDASAKTLVARK